MRSSLHTALGSALADERLPNGMRVSDEYVVWRGRQYVPGGADPSTGRIVIQFYGLEPLDEGFKRKKSEPRHRLPKWSRWVPLDEIEERFYVRTTGVWRDAEFRVVSKSDDVEDAADNPDVLVEGPRRAVGEPRPFSWWLELPNLELLDRGLAFGWVPWSELTDVREEVEEEPSFPAP